MRILPPITQIEVIARGHGEYARLCEQFGGRSWKKCKGVATVATASYAGLAKVHWYACTGVGRVKMKVKRWL